MNCEEIVKKGRKNIMFEKNYASIVAPLESIKNKLAKYVNEQRERISTLRKKQDEINMSIGTAENEIKKSEHTTEKISALLSVDLVEDGTTDAKQVDIVSSDSSEEKD
jgi:gas vesicle protein